MLTLVHLHNSYNYGIIVLVLHVNLLTPLTRLTVNLTYTCSSRLYQATTVREGEGFYSQTNLPGLTLKSRIEPALCYNFVLLAPSLSTGLLSAPSVQLVPNNNVTRSGRIGFIGASLSEPHLVTTAAALSI